MDGNDGSNSDNNGSIMCSNFFDDGGSMAMT